MSVVPQFMTQRRNVVIAAVLGIAALSGTLLAITREGPAKYAANVVFELAQSDVLTVQPKALNRTLRLSGSLEPLRHVVVKAHGAGTLVEMRVNEGNRVRAGELLARVDPRNPQAELIARTAALRKAEADLLLATKNRDNSIVLLNQKLISQNAFDQTEAAFAAAQAGVETAQAQVSLAKIALDDTAIRAEFDGVIAERHVQAGERVTPDAPIVTLVDLREMQLEALVPVAEVPSIQVGQTAHFTVDGFGAREFSGHVERINPQTQTGTRSLAVYLTVANSDGALKGGMFADGELLIAQTDARIAVPTRAIHNDEAGDYVLALQDGIITRSTVKAGATFAETGMTVIESGLSPATQIIVAPATTLKPGNKATVVEG